MLEDSALTQALGTALARLLRPLVRLMLQHSFSYSAFESVAKRVYAECAMEDFALPGRKPSVSRAAILTGLTRKEVNTLLTEPWNGANADSTHYNRAARVVTAWVRESRFSGIDGMPRALAMEGTCTGEHGVGQGKMKYLADEYGEATLEMMRAIKRSLDPRNIMNPGKIVRV